jgi:hypothetical protein
MSGLKLHHSSAILLITFVVTACSAYEKYGYGEIAGSRLDESQVTLIDLPENAPSISSITCFDSGLEYQSTPTLLTYPVPCRGVEWKQ